MFSVRINTKEGKIGKRKLTDVLKVFFFILFLFFVRTILFICLCLCVCSLFFMYVCNEWQAVGRNKSPTLFQRLPHNYGSHPGEKALLARRRHYVGLLLSNALTVDVSTTVSCCHHPIAFILVYLFKNLSKNKAPFFLLLLLSSSLLCYIKIYCFFLSK